LEWKVLYVGSANDSTRDLVLDEILVGPIPVGVNKFVLQADAPDPAQISKEDLLGVTVVLVTCSYKEREFVRVGYYVNNEYPGLEPAAPGQDPPPPPHPLEFTQIVRTILADRPRVTRFPIPWTNSTEPESSSSNPPSETIQHTTNSNSIETNNDPTSDAMMNDKQTMDDSMIEEDDKNDGMVTAE
jgi:histone chaperone ASF1